MTRAIEFLADIKEGKLVTPKHLAAFFNAREGKQVKAILSEDIKRRSLNQNSYLHGVIIPHVREFRMEQGDTVSLEQVKEDLIAEFSPINIEWKTLNGVKLYRQKRTHELTTQEMNNFITAITARLAEFGFTIPLEGEYHASC